MEEGEMNLDNKFPITKGVIVLRTFVWRGHPVFPGNHQEGRASYR